jgi:hypothetical protein
METAYPWPVTGLPKYCPYAGCDLFPGGSFFWEPFTDEATQYARIGQVHPSNLQSHCQIKTVIFRDFRPIPGSYAPENGRMILQCSIFQKSFLRLSSLRVRDNVY